MSQAEVTPEVVQITKLRDLLDHNTLALNCEIRLRDGTIIYTYYDFTPITTHDKKRECYEAMINFFLLDIPIFTMTTDICQKLYNLFSHPTEQLFGTMINKQFVASYIVLEFTVFCMQWVQQIFVSDSSNKNEKLGRLQSGLDGFDNGFSFTTSTLSQLFYCTKEPSPPLGTKKEYKRVTRVLSSCISIQRNLEQVGISRQLYTFACNRIVSLYIERIGNPTSKVRIYTDDFKEDRVPWKDYVMDKCEPTIRRNTMKAIHSQNIYMMKLLNLLSLVRPAWKGGDGNSTTTCRRTRTRCATRTRRTTCRRTTRRRR